MVGDKKKISGISDIICEFIGPNTNLGLSTRNCTPFFTSRWLGIQGMGKVLGKASGSSHLYCDVTDDHVTMMVTEACVAKDVLVLATIYASETNKKWIQIHSFKYDTKTQSARVVFTHFKKSEQTLTFDLDHALKTVTEIWSMTAMPTANASVLIAPANASDDDDDDLDRDESWALYCSKMDVVDLGTYSEHCAKIREQVDAALTEIWVGVGGLRRLVAEFAVFRKEVWVARCRLMRVLSPWIMTRANVGNRKYDKLPNDQVIPQLLDDTPEDQLVTIENQVSSWDPCEYDDTDRRFLCDKRQEMQCCPYLDCCQGCKKDMWTQVHIGTEALTLKLSNIHSLGDFGEYPYVCADCRCCCGCSTPTKIDWYQHKCANCNQGKCIQHQYLRSPLVAAYHRRGSQFQSTKERCDDCIQSYELGTAFSAILQDPWPHKALALYLKNHAANQ